MFLKTIQELSHGFMRIQFIFVNSIFFFSTYKKWILLNWNFLYFKIIKIQVLTNILE